MKFLEKEWNGKIYRFYAQRDKSALWIHFQGRTWLWSSQKSKKKSPKQALKKEELITSALPGRIQKIFVKKFDKVKRGQNLLILSAMKIEYTFQAEGTGQVEEIFCKKDQTVDMGQKLIKIKYF